MSVARKLAELGLVGTTKYAFSTIPSRVIRPYHLWATRHALRYRNPSRSELIQIERDLARLGVELIDYRPSPSSLHEFKKADYFPPDYHGGVAGGVWDEKIVEHWISSELLELAQFTGGDIYVDVAACASPWVKVLRERGGIDAFAIDLELAPQYRGLTYYREEDATATSFPASSVRGASLHCAFEMFEGQDDVDLLHELARILKPGGKAVILPLYMHTHYCAYSTPEFFGKGYSDPAAKEYVRADFWGIRTSRKYDATTLMERLLHPIEALGMRYRLLVLRNAHELGQGVYCHFILEVTR